MRQIVHCTLVTTSEQDQVLLDLFHTFNAACTYIAEQASATHNVSIFAIQEVTAGPLIQQFHLPLALALRAIFATYTAYKLRPRGKLTFPPERSLLVDERIVAFQGLGRVSILTLAGWITLPFLIERTRRVSQKSAPGQARLNYHHGRFSLTVTLDATFSPTRGQGHKID